MSLVDDPKQQQSQLGKEAEDQSLARGVPECRREEGRRRSLPFSGTIAGTNTDILPAIASVLRNAFARAFTHSIDGSISLDDVQGPIAD